MKKINFGMNIGSSSLLLVFVVLCLVSFSVLSLSSAVADERLADKSIEKNITYYEASNLAQEKLAEIDKELVAAYEKASTSKEFFELVGEGSSFTIPVSDNQELWVSVEYKYPDGSGKLYTVTDYHLETVVVPEMDNSLNLF